MCDYLPSIRSRCFNPVVSTRPNHSTRRQAHDARHGCLILYDKIRATANAFTTKQNNIFISVNCLPQRPAAGISEHNDWVIYFLNAKQNMGKNFATSCITVSND
jgi:hypothetical protein